MHIARRCSAVGRSLLRFARSFESIMTGDSAVNSSACSKSPLKYPQARRDETKYDIHGKEMLDPYRWLEDPDAPETKAFVDELNGVTFPYLEKCTVRSAIRDRFAALYDYEKFGCPRKEGDHYFYYHNSGLQNQSVLYIQDSLDAEAKVFFDPNLLSADGTTAIQSTAYTDDGRIFAYTLSEKGSDWNTCKFKRIPSGEDLPDVLTKLKFSSLAWTKDGKGIFYNSYPDVKSDSVGTTTEKCKFQKLYYHRLGTDQSADVLCVECPDEPDFMIRAEVSEDGQYLLVTIDRGCDPTNKLYYYDIKNGGEINGKLELKPLIDTFEMKLSFVCNKGELFTVMTDWNAPMYRLMNIDIKNVQREHWKELVPESPKLKLDWATLVNGNRLVLNYMEDVKDILCVLDLHSGKELYRLPLDIGSVTGFTGKEHLSEIFYSFQSFLTPSILYHCDLTNEPPVPKVFRETKVKGFEASRFETRQVFYSSKDGTKIPMFVVHRKGLVYNGENPVLLYGYGGFNVSMNPSFSVSRVMFIDNMNGVFALANIRGGSEYGETWHQAAMRERRENVFNDFIAAAEYLVEKKYTKPAKLAIQGGSGGGLLVAVCANRRPELYGCVLNYVGLFDMLRFHLFTIGSAWVPEFGDPRNKEDTEFLLKYSPLHNIKTPTKADAQYPAMLLLTGDHDDRVVPLHSLKYAAELYHCVRESTYQTKPLLVRVDTKSGHGAGKPTSKIIDEIADAYAFLQLALDLKWAD